MVRNRSVFLAGTIALSATFMLFAWEPVFAQSLTFDRLEEESLFFTDEDIASISSLLRQPVDKAPGAVSVITSSSIEKAPARFLTDILKTVPGLDVRQDNFGDYYLSVVGLDEPSNILVMIDGHRFNDVFTGRALYDLPVDGIERVEIIRGPGSALYGTNAMAGGINIITKRPEGLQAGAGIGSFDTKKANVQFGSKGDDWAVHGFANFYDTAGADTMINSDRLSYSQPNFSYLPRKKNDSQRKIMANLGGEYGKMEAKLTYYGELRGPGVAFHDIVSDKSSVESDYLSFDLSGKFEPMAGLAVTPRLYADRWKWNNRVQLYPDGYTDPRDLNGDGAPETFPDGKLMHKSYESWTYGADVITQLAAGGHNVTVGANLETSVLKNPSISTNYKGEADVGSVLMPYLSNWNGYELYERSRSVYAVYIQDEWVHKAGVSLVVGARYDHYSDFGDTTNPRAAVTWSITDRLSAKLQYATAFGAPTFQQLYDRSDLQFYGNPKLNPEKMETVEAGLGYKLADKGYVRLNAFRNLIKDNITTLFNFSTASATSYENAGEIEVVGGSLDTKFTKGATTLTWNATMFNARDKMSNTWLTRIPQFRMNTGVSASLPWKSSVSVNWMFSDVVEANARTYNERLPTNTSAVDPQTLLNIAFTKGDFLYDGVKLKVSAFNLFNSLYREMYSDIRYRLSGVDKPLLTSNERYFMLELGKDF